MAIIPITEAMIKAAHVEFDCRRQDPVDDRATVEDVVVARGVTLEDMDDVDPDWLGDIRLALLPDGTLIVDRPTLGLHTDAIGQTYMEVKTSVRELKQLRLSVREEVEVDYKAFGVRTNDIVVLHAGEPLVVFEVVVDGASIMRSLNMAAGYLQHSETLERVVIFYCSPSVIENGLWKVAALAMVFGLADPTDRASRVQLLEAQSFGNVGVDVAVVDVLVAGLAVPEVEPLSRERGRPLLQAGLPWEIRDSCVFGDVSDKWLWIPLQIALQAVEDMELNLAPVFITAVDGFASDRFHPSSSTDADQLSRQ